MPARRKAGARERNLDELARRLEGTGRANAAVADLRTGKRARGEGRGEIRGLRKCGRFRENRVPELRLTAMPAYTAMIRPFRPQRSRSSSPATEHHSRQKRSM
jgi:hypothetical protein